MVRKNMRPMDPWGALEGPDDAYECFYNWTLWLTADPLIREQTAILFLNLQSDDRIVLYYRVQA